MFNPAKWWELVSEVHDKLPLPPRIWEKRAVAPSADICDEPLVCLQFNSQWAAFFSGAIGALQDRRYWQGDDDEYHRISQAISKVLEQMAIPCSQPSEIPSLGDITNMYNDPVYNYNGSPTSVHYNAPDTTFDTDADDNPFEAQCRKNALCEAAQLWVRMAVEWEVNRRQSAGDYGTFMLGGIAGLKGIFPFLPTWWGPAYAIAAAIWEVGSSVFADVSDARLSDPCNQFPVACCLAANLEGLEPTFENFCGSLEACDPALPADSEEIRGAIAYLTCELPLFLQFLILLGTGQGNCVFGQRAVGCGCDTWCHIFDFTASDGGFTQAAGAGGSWQEGVGWVHGDSSGIGQPAERRVRIIKLAGAFSVRYAEITVDYQFGHIEGADPPVNWWTVSGGGCTWITRDSSQPSGLVTLKWTGDCTGPNIDIYLRSSWDNVFPKTFSGQVIVKSLKLAGCGQNPFWGCNTCYPPVIFECQPP